MNGIVEQLVDDIEDFPAMRWKNVKTETPDKEKLLLVIPIEKLRGHIFPIVVKFQPNLPKLTRRGIEIPQWSEANHDWDQIEFEYYIELENIPVPKDITLPKKFDKNQ